ncbi:MAG: YtfJ family protein [Mixta calida]|uniref:YtfJ family protein n=1 Tax=Mixta calida TaxID=665913 RepID=A0ABN5H691_9GAMM|nr:MULTISPECIES: YtfJ family protein [Mixta]AIX75040.1 hypothetical protein PSNIH2_15495 [Pantoea sp. PSNIH2]MBS6059560.1 YtfJ family protein [Pantoea sp.]POU41210.1 YtfJ family protein [Pantoea sp. PSNIH5]POU70322.1 YtfJ family protein [Pantoea sp. PSNIH4]POY65696.1 YtfJ family protein [Pantoea sp. PSNIH3]
MTLRAAIVLLTGGLPFFASAHNFVEGERVAPVGVAERGELQLQQGELRYQAWNSARLSGKVGVVLHMAGRLSAKDQNAALIDAIGKAGFPANRFAVTTIVNTDDAIPGSALFVRRSLEESKRETPAAQFVVDDRGATQRAWRLQTGGSAIVVLDKGGRVRFAKDGALTAAEVDQVMVLLRQLLA